MQVWGELEDESLVQLKHMSAPAFLALQVVKTKVPTLLLTWDEEPNLPPLLSCFALGPLLGSRRS